MSDDGNESDAEIAEETPPLPAPDAGEGENWVSGEMVARRCPGHPPAAFRCRPEGVIGDLL